MYWTDDDLASLLLEGAQAQSPPQPTQPMPEAPVEPEQELGAMMQQAELRRNSLLYPLLEAHRRKELRPSEFAAILDAAKKSKDSKQRTDIEADGITFLQNLGDDAPAFAKIYSDYFPGRGVVKYKTNPVSYMVANPQAAARNMNLTAARIKYERDYNRMLAERDRWNDAHDAAQRLQRLQARGVVGSEDEQDLLLQAGGVGATPDGFFESFVALPRRTPPPDRIQFPEPEPMQVQKYRQVDFTVGREPSAGSGTPKERLGQFTLPDMKGGAYKIDLGNYSAATNSLKSINENTAQTIINYTLQENFGNPRHTAGTYTVYGRNPKTQEPFATQFRFETVDAAAYAQLAQKIASEGVRTGNKLMWRGLNLDMNTGQISAEPSMDIGVLQSDIKAALDAVNFFGSDKKGRPSANFGIPYNAALKRRNTLDSPYSDLSLKGAIETGVPLRVALNVRFGGTNVGGEALQYIRQYVLGKSQ